MAQEDSDKNQIGIKLADGNFYPVFDEDFKGKKKLTLTTVRDDQKSVQIDLFKGHDETIFEDSYIGSLVIENIEAAAKGEPEIELLIGIDEDGNLKATADDYKTGEKQSLSVSLESVEDKDMYTIPEFEIDQTIPETPDAEEEIELEAQTVVGDSSPVTQVDSEQPRVQKRKGNPLALVLFILLGLVVITVGGWGIYSLIAKVPFLPGGYVTDQTEASSAQEQAEVDEEDVGAPELEDTEQPAETAEEEIAVEETAEETAEQTGEGEEYTVIWGDTLWDIARRYYRDPFEYKMIAKVNNIENPDLIFAKQKIFLPAK
ncbi:MAG: LysM peptidoglycan-binding domain-containing protein [Spirochaetales bacterium]|nr:LysM peptidoglycan-binding domain-containing protein [Spirochaetales bacterium]